MDLDNPLDEIQTGQSQKEVTANEAIDALSPAALYGRRASTSNLLTWGFYGGRVDSTLIAHGTVTLTASDTNYIVANKSTGAVSVSTSNTNWNDSTNYTRLYLVETDGTGPDPAQPWEDHRQVLGAAAPLGTSVTAADVSFDDTGLTITAADVQEALEELDAAIAGGSSLTQEQVEDIAAALIVGGTGISVQYNDADSPPTVAVSLSAGFASALQSFPVACSDETSALTTGTAKVTFRMPFAFTLTGARASLTTAQTGGSIFTVDINESGSTILSTKITIDNGEKTSTTAATPPVLGDSSLADDAEITIDIDQIGDGTAVGLKVYLTGYPT